MKEDLKVYDNVLQLVGNTPLIHLNKITEGFKGQFSAKVEAFNPGHSSKDRIALYIIEEAEKKASSNPVIPLSKPLPEIPVLVSRW